MGDIGFVHMKTRQMGYICFYPQYGNNGTLLECPREGEPCDQGGITHSVRREPVITVNQTKWKIKGAMSQIPFGFEGNRVASLRRAQRF
jgi:hypothetical protein